MGTNSPGSSLATATIIGMTNDNTTATPYYNGTAMTTKNGNMGSGTTGFALGAINSNGAQSWDGPIAEIVVTNSVLSTADRQKLEGYLAHKWGLTKLGIQSSIQEHLTATCFLGR